MKKARPRLTTVSMDLLPAEQMPENEKKLIWRRIVLADFQSWKIFVEDPIFGETEPSIGDYLKYFRCYLFFYSEGSPKDRRNKSSARSFFSRLWTLARRLLTNSLKPSQLLPASSRE